MNLRPYQVEAAAKIREEWRQGRKRTLIVLPTGTGKCLGKGTPVLMFSGEVKPVENLRVGDLLIGPDSLPRKIKSVCCGQEMLYRVTPKKGDPYVVNESHILSLKRTKEKASPEYACQKRSGEVVNIPVLDYIKKTKWWKHIHKGWRCGVVWGQQEPALSLDPYFLGLWLGDGSSRTACICTGDKEIETYLADFAKESGTVIRREWNSENSTNIHLTAPEQRKGPNTNPISRKLLAMNLFQNKHIPLPYKTASWLQRLSLLAGIIDADGHYSRGQYDICIKSERLLDDIIFVARSLGFSCYKKIAIKTCTNNAKSGTYWRCIINGAVDSIPCKVKRKKATARLQKKDVLVTGISVESLGVGDYYGFQLDGPDGLFLLGDFTVTHNTIVFSAVIRDEVRDGARCLILAHRGELLDQAADKLAKSTGLGCAVEKADATCRDQWFRVVVGSVQTMMRPKRLATFPHDYFDVIIVDEAHHCLAQSYQRILEHFKEAKVLGVTATPDRGDMKELGEYFDSLACEYPLPRAIKEGFLCPIRALTIPIKLDLTQATTRGGDYRPEDIGTALDPYLHQIADEMRQHCQGRRTVVFLPLIATSQKFARILADRGFRVTEVNGESPDRKEKLTAFEAGRYDVLCNSMLLTEGWDCPPVDCIVPLRATKIRSLYAQICGRGTRIHPGKDHLLLLDFLWLTQKHELCRPAHLLAPDADVADKMTEEIAAAGCPVDLEAAERNAESSCVEEREERLAKKLAEQRNKKQKLVDPLQFEMSIQAEDLVNYVPAFGWEAGPVSAKQADALEAAHIFPGGIDSAGKAEKILEIISKRRSDGLSTPKQIRKLEQFGFQHVGAWEFDAAKKMIDRIAGNGWRTPPGVNPREFQPAPRKQPEPVHAALADDYEELLF